jgi:hypothetical protein
MVQLLLAQSPPIILTVLTITLLLVLAMFAIVDTMLLHPIHLIALLCGLFILRLLKVRTTQVQR